MPGGPPLRYGLFPTATPSGRLWSYWPVPTSTVSNAANPTTCSARWRAPRRSSACTISWTAPFRAVSARNCTSFTNQRNRWPSHGCRRSAISTSASSATCAMRRTRCAPPMPRAWRRPSHASGSSISGGPITNAGPTRRPRRWRGIRGSTGAAKRPRDKCAGNSATATPWSSVRSWRAAPMSSPRPSSRDCR